MRKKNIDTNSENRLIYVDICFRNEAFKRKQTKNKKIFSTQTSLPFNNCFKCSIYSFLKILSSSSSKYLFVWAKNISPLPIPRQSTTLINKVKQCMVIFCKENEKENELQRSDFQVFDIFYSLSLLCSSRKLTQNVYLN